MHNSFSIKHLGNFVRTPVDLSSKKVGIWGYGIVGKATAHYLIHEKVSISVCDTRTLSIQDMHTLHSNNIPFYTQKELISFLTFNDFIVPSPGINVQPYKQFAHKWLSELDLFANAWHKSIIAITGTVGKTTVTNLINLLLKKANIHAVTGGNIGIGMLSLITKQKKYALLELSSWQLGYCKQFAPSIALWTNFSENHLDRHKTMESYFNAKYQIVAHQDTHDVAIVPLSLIKPIYQRSPKSTLIFFCNGIPPKHTVKKQDAIFYLHKNRFYLLRNQSTTCISRNIHIPDYSFADNWIVISALLHLLKLPINLINKLELNNYVQPDRLEFVCTKNGISFYNDSKSTTPASTYASVHKFAEKRTHLFLGGLSKGTDRSCLINSIKEKVVSIYCFGKEAQELKNLCDTHGVKAYKFKSLNLALQKCIKNCQQGDIVLFSPAGNSFDLFINYHERGKQFKKLVYLIK